MGKGGKRIISPIDEEDEEEKTAPGSYSAGPQLTGGTTGANEV